VEADKTRELLTAGVKKNNFIEKLIVDN